LSSENQGGSEVVSIDRYCFSVGVMDIFIPILKGHHLGLCKKCLQLLKPKLLVMREKMVQRLPICKNMVLAPIGVALDGI
jgi:hypothetical protein